MSNDPIALNYHDTLIRSSDIKLLKGPHWLNDQIISFYFEYLQKEKFSSNNRIVFISPEVTQLIKLLRGPELGELLMDIPVIDKDFVFFALNDNNTTGAGGTHWSLLVLSRLENTFFHYDSLHKTNLPECESFVKNLRTAMNFSNFKIKSPKCLQQSNSYDCGIHVLSWADKIAEFLRNKNGINNFEGIDKNEVSNKRQEIIAIIERLGGIV